MVGGAQASKRRSRRVGPSRSSEAEGATLREAGDINKSLFTLRKAIEYLA